MTTIDDQNAQRVASGSDGLTAFNDAGVLNAADVHVARRVAQLSGAPVGDDVLLATALAVRAVRTGSTCVELHTIADLAPADEPSLPWPDPTALRDALAASHLVLGCPSGPLRPLALADSDDGPLLYLRKYFRQEQSIRTILDQRAASRPEVNASALANALNVAFGTGDDGGYDRQRAAAALAATSWTTVLAGGPGTGKTYTVARILSVMEALFDGDLRIGLCAPTGRAAAQLQTAIGEYRREHETLRSEPAAVTVHRLLGSRPDGTFLRGAANRLPYDVVVVDETSMLPVTMMCRLLESLRSDTRLILVGDPHQLVSVEAGAVLADLVDRDPSTDDAAELPQAFVDVTDLETADFEAPELVALARGVITLRRGHRYGDSIGEVAEAVNAGDADRVLELIGEGSNTDHPVRLIEPESAEEVRGEAVGWAGALRSAALAGDARAAVTSLRGHRVLCAHRDGPYGVAGWSRRVIGWITDDLAGPPAGGGWYAGEPLLVTANDRAQGVYNGDSGVVIRDGDGLAAVFERGHEIKQLHPSQLADAVPVYAMTIHRSQGSQFGSVTVVLPPPDAELLTRELLYTAITRAEREVNVIGTPAALRAAVGRRVARASGLRTNLVEVIAPADDQPDSDE
ncbi:exodeoxyribonuclease V subunit alpha [Gordonia sp. (in: high G+C Gram-positive bacteria)]|uniref:exodeoxyribonuclease V subunit alpha n=1 Tax=Gordonia sp. (in: high G+C Gram-positive bacteria) TaxID=84139 RepID=UPI0016B7F1E9|nr:exodeoxyribonuclease V subunit alpha [Gordonia sp. (in: high G+C Gram-positive bacteria)]NLG46339.1 exodeoxyribonuclease V subunit alpha [Gordonia sp. (in: high G+C Gram-positive bacteria)]